VCLIAAAAAQGRLWAAAVLLAIAGLALTLAVHAMLFGLLQVVARLRGAWAERGSAQAQAGPPTS
jgi:hypothetical protein